MPTGSSALPPLVSPQLTTHEEFLRHILARDQMKEFSKRPLVMDRADGVRYWDVNGKEYIDGISGIYVASVGHNNRRVLDAVREQMERLNFSPPMHGTNATAIQLANLLAEIAPGDLNTVKFECGGSEVTEAAIKMARQYHQLTGNPRKFKIISRYMSWHGSTFGSLSASGLKSRRSVNEPLAGGFIHVFPPTCYRCPFGKEYPTCDITCCSLIGDVIDMEGPETVAAVMVEPIGHTGGVIDPPHEYLPMLREICDRHNVLLIFDEIITGMGRTGRMFAAETFGVLPDMICVGKGLSGGYVPLSALICRDHIARAFWGDAPVNPGFVEGHTFEGNPVSCAAGIAVIREIIERELLANARAMGDRLRAGLEQLRGKYSIIGDIRGKGMFLAVEFVKDAATKERFPADRPIGTLIGRRALDNGLLTRFDPTWIAFGPPLVITAGEVDQILAIMDRSMAEVLAAAPAAYN
jgi:adenosylmethionine-8-amino-7-oxononanoate aminotransferase